MKTLTSITNLFLILSVGCSSSVEQPADETDVAQITVAGASSPSLDSSLKLPTVAEQQRDIQLMQDMFFAASNSLQAVPMAPLVVTDLVRRQIFDLDRSSRLSALETEVELAPSSEIQDRQAAVHQ